MRKLAINAAVVLAIVAAAAVAWHMRGALVLVLLSVAIAAAVRPPLQVLVRRGVPRALALAMIYFLALATVAALVAALGGPILGELPGAADRLVAGYERARAVGAAGSGVARMIAGSLPAWADVMGRVPGDLGGIAMQALFATRSVFELITSVMVTIVLSVYWAARRDPFEMLIGLFTEPLRAHRIRVEWRHLWGIAGGHLSAALVRIALSSLVLAVAFRALGLPFWALCAFAAAVFSLIPFIGVPLAVMTGLLAAAPEGAALAGMVAALTFAIVVVVDHGAQRILHVHCSGPILLVLSALALMHVLGFLGLLIAAPVAAMLSHLTHLGLQRRTTWHFATRGVLVPGLPSAIDTLHGNTR